MKATAAPRNATHRWIRQLHLWFGAWGALAAVLYGFTGLVMNHRFGEGAWPQGDTAERGRVVLEIPADAAHSAEALSLWLGAQGYATDVIRKGGPAKPGTAPKWTLSSGTASAGWSLEFTPGSTDAEIKHSRHSTLAAVNRLHKGVGGGLAWRLLGDSFAVGMLMLGLSGLWMWARGRSARQMVASVVGVAVLALVAVLGPALL